MEGLQRKGEQLCKSVRGPVGFGYILQTILIGMETKSAVDRRVGITRSFKDFLRFLRHDAEFLFHAHALKEV